MRRHGDQVICALVCRIHQCEGGMLGADHTRRHLHVLGLQAPGDIVQIVAGLFLAAPRILMLPCRCMLQCNRVEHCEGLDDANQRISYISMAAHHERRSDRLLGRCGAVERDHHMPEGDIGGRLFRSLTWSHDK